MNKSASAISLNGMTSTISGREKRVYNESKKVQGFDAALPGSSSFGSLASLAALNVERKRSSGGCDVKLVSAEGVVFPAHRQVLRECSEFFRGMFSCSKLDCDQVDGQQCRSRGFVESSSSKCHMRSIGTETLAFILDYIYSGGRDGLLDSGSLHAARNENKYLIDGGTATKLRESARKVAESVPERLFFPLFTAAHFCSLDWLYAFCRAAIARRPFDLAFEHPEFVDCVTKNPAIAELILDNPLILLAGSDSRISRLLSNCWPSDSELFNAINTRLRRLEATQRAVSAFVQRVSSSSSLPSANDSVTSLLLDEDRVAAEVYRPKTSVDVRAQANSLRPFECVIFIDRSLDCCIKFTGGRSEQWWNPALDQAPLFKCQHFAIVSTCLCGSRHSNRHKNYKVSTNLSAATRQLLWYATSSQIFCTAVTSFSEISSGGSGSTQQLVYESPADDSLPWPPLLRSYGRFSVFWTEDNRRKLCCYHSKTRCSNSKCNRPIDGELVYDFRRFHGVCSERSNSVIVRHIATSDYWEDYQFVVAVVTDCGRWKVVRKDSLLESTGHFVDLCCPLEHVECVAVLRGEIYVLGCLHANLQPLCLLKYADEPDHHHISSMPFEDGVSGSHCQSFKKCARNYEKAAVQKSARWITLCDRKRSCVPSALIPLNGRLFVVSRGVPTVEVYEPALDIWMLDPFPDLVDLGGFSLAPFYS